MALGILVLLFVGMSAISILGLLLLYLVKKEPICRVIFYSMSVWGMLIAVLSATIQPANRLGQQLIAWGFGLLGAAGLIVRIRAKGDGGRRVACALIAVSIIGGMLKLWF